MAKKNSSVSTSAPHTEKQYKQFIVEIASMEFGYRKDEEGNVLSETPSFGNLETDYPETFDGILYMNDCRESGVIFADPRHHGLMLYIVRDDKKFFKGKITENGQWKSQYTDYNTGEVSHHEFKYFQTKFWTGNPNKDAERQALRVGDKLVFAIAK